MKKRECDWPVGNGKCGKPKYRMASIQFTFVPLCFTHYRLWRKNAMRHRAEQLAAERKAAGRSA